MRTLTGVPRHPFTEGVMVYVALPGIAPVAVNVCAIVEPLDAVAPVTPACTTVQLNIVPATLLDNAIEVAVPEQIVCDAGVGVTTGTGLTVTVTMMGTPGHPFDEGVIV